MASTAPWPALPTWAETVIAEFGIAIRNNGSRRIRPLLVDDSVELAVEIVRPHPLPFA
jgi:hypothetical protein